VWCEICVLYGVCGGVWVMVVGWVVGGGLLVVWCVVEWLCGVVGWVL